MKVCTESKVSMIKSQSNQDDKTNLNSSKPEDKKSDFSKELETAQAMAGTGSGGGQPDRPTGGG